MSDAKVTVLMLVYNAEKYIREAIESILNQTFEDFELLILLDSKTNDSSEDIIKTYVDKRIRLVENEKSMGLSELRNKGLRLARGEYVAIMDADDISYPNRLGMQYEYMEKNPDVGIVASWNDVIDSGGKVVESWRPHRSSEDIYYFLNFRNCLAHCSILLRKDLVVNSGGYDESMRLSEDYALYSRVSKIARISQIQELLVKWRKHEASIGAKNRNELIERANGVATDNLEHLAEKKIDDRILRLIRDNFDKINYHDLETVTKNEVLCLTQLINEINEKIIHNAPHGLNKDKVRRIAQRKLVNYICLRALKVGILDSVGCLTRCVRGNALVKTRIMMLVVCRYLRYCIRRL